MTAWTANRFGNPVGGPQVHWDYWHWHAPTVGGSIRTAREPASVPRASVPNGGTFCTLSWHFDSHGVDDIRGCSGSCDFDTCQRYTSP